MRQRYVSLRACDEASWGSDIHLLSFAPWWNSNRQAAVILELASACSQGPVDLTASCTSETIRKIATLRNVIVVRLVHTHVRDVGVMRWNRSNTRETSPPSLVVIRKNRERECTTCETYEFQWEILGVIENPLRTPEHSYVLSRSYLS